MTPKPIMIGGKVCEVLHGAIEFEGLFYTKKFWRHAKYLSDYSTRLTITLFGQTISKEDINNVLERLEE